MDIARLGIEVDARGVDKASKSLDKFGRESQQADRHAAKLNKSMGGMKTAAKSLGAVLGAIGITRLVGGMADASIALDAMESSLTVATGSASAAAVEMQYLRDEAERLGLELRTSGDAFASLAAAARGTALEGQGARDIFTAVSEAMTALGRDSNATEGALRAIEQMISKGSVSAEELRGQLGERLPGAFQLAARSIGVTTAELNKMLQNGEVLTESLLPNMARLLRSTFSGRAEEMAGKLQGQINLFRNAVFDLMTSGNMDDLAGAIGDFTDLIKDPGFQAGFSSFVGGIVQLANWSGQAASGIATLGNYIGTNLARNIYGPLMDTPGEVQNAIDDVESQLDLLDDELETFRLRRINPFKSDEELLKDYNELVNKLATLKELKRSLTASPAAPDAPATGGGGGEDEPSGGLTEEQIKAIAKARESLAEMNQSLTQQAATFGMSEVGAIKYRLSLGDLSDEVKLLGAEGNKFAESIIAQTKALQEAEQAAEVADSYNTLTQELQLQRSELQMTERQMFIYQASARLSINANQAMREETERLAGALYDEKQALEETNDARADAESIMRSVMNPMEQYLETLRKIDAAEDEGGLGLVHAARARQKAFEDMKEAAKSTADDMTKFMERAAENIQDVMGDTLYDVMQGNFDDIGSGFKSMLDRMVAEALAADLAGRIFGSSMGGTGDGWLGSLTSMAGGLFGGGGGTPQGITDLAMTALPSFDGGGYTGDGPRSGGLDGKGGMLMMGHPQETVIDHTKGQGAGGNVTVNVSVSGIRDSADLRRSASQIAQQAGAAANRALSRNA